MLLLLYTVLFVVLRCTSLLSGTEGLSACLRASGLFAVLLLVATTGIFVIGGIITLMKIATSFVSFVPSCEKNFRTKA